MTIEVCQSSFYMTFFIHIVFSSALFFLSLKYSRGEIGSMLFVKIIFDIIVLLSLPLLMLMTRGMC